MLGTLLAGRYKILTSLGAGGFGQTFLAEDTQGHRQCVVKQFQPSSRETKFLEVARRLFDTEVNMLRLLGQHDQIPDFFDSFEENKEFYLVQELIEGISLAEEFSRRSRLTEDEAIAILKDVLTVLQFVHQNQVIHRDIKPGNLIRRKQDGCIVLIDFGAVKEIQTQMTGMSGKTNLTVGIGTQGYTPSEQLMGKPRYCSDIYALGMTVIQALTGIPPARLPDDELTQEVQWHSHATASPGLAFILDRMVRYDYMQRYQSATDVLHALGRLGDLPTSTTEIPSEIELSELLLPEALFKQLQTQPTVPPKSWQQRLQEGLKTVAIASLAVSGLFVGARYLGWTESWELAAYDQLVRLQPEQPPDPRLLVVGITEADLQALQRATPSDASIAEAIANLQLLQPRLIGLDLLRDLPQDPGREQLLQQFAANNVIAITQIGNTTTNQVPPPPGVPDQQVGFNDLTLDADNVVRRNLMFATVGDTPMYSFSARLALQYLAKANMTPQDSQENPGTMVVGDRTFPPLEATFGGYQPTDAQGYQIMLRYRSNQPAEMVSLSDVLSGTLTPEQVSDRIILIGTTAPSAKDLFYTPYSAGQDSEHQMPGVMVHAAMTSQLLTTVLDGEAVPWAISDWAELIILIGCTVTGSTIAWVQRHPAVLVGGLVVGVGGLAGAGVATFAAGGWVPLVTPAIALVLSIGGVSVYRAYAESREQQEMTALWWGATTAPLTRSRPR
ncbi:CHASE2 domain-containing protein [Leptolyngbya sp. AN02str]|uniref:CHASE2 domain-containing protein n=1 Tax=Leptolyngbya sp. AN02str TaxID=3423363 RepID=UPI003D318905